MYLIPRSELVKDINENIKTAQHQQRQVSPSSTRHAELETEIQTWQKARSLALASTPVYLD